MKLIAKIILGCLPLLTTAQAASFDCGKAALGIETLICGDEKLSKLDEELNSTYKKVMQNDNKADEVRNTQKRWVKERNLCLDVGCVKLAYQNRLSELQSASESNNADSAGNISSPKDTGFQSWNYNLIEHYQHNPIFSFFVNQQSNLAFIPETNVIPETNKLEVKVTLLDISDVSNPKVISSIDMSSLNASPVELVSNRAGTILYVACQCMWEKFGCDGIYIIDIKDHFHPRIIKSYNFISKVSHFALSRDEKKLFVLDSAKNSIAILDVRDSGDVKVLGQLKLKTYDEYKGHIDSFSLSSNNDLIYFSVVAKGLYIVDAKNPKHMKILGSIQPFEYRINDWLGKFVVSDDDRIAFLTSTLNGDMVALDISNPEKIQNLGVVRRYDKPELNDVILSPGNLQWKGKRLYIGWHHMYASGVTVLDVGTPTSPQLIGEIKTQVSNFDFSASLTDFSEFVVSDDEKTIFIAPHNSGRYGKPTDADLTKNGLDIYSRQ